MILYDRANLNLDDVGLLRVDFLSLGGVFIQQGEVGLSPGTVVYSR